MVIFRKMETDAVYIAASLSMVEAEQKSQKSEKKVDFHDISRSLITYLVNFGHYY